MGSAIGLFLSPDTDDYKVVTVLGKPYVARKRWKADKSYKFLEQSEIDQKAILLDQAILLGKQHRKSLKGNVEKYVNDLNEVKFADKLDTTIESIQTCIDHTYDVLNK
jgi:hypothetical protein